MSETIEHKAVDRTGWPSGPWDNEPDRVEWRTAAGLPALALRSSALGSGNWCGYVAVPPGHPLHGKHHNDADVHVHGGLTYSGACSGKICHVPAPGEPDNVHWLGFDCAHCWDLAPGRRVLSERCGIDLVDPSATYRDLTYVRRECELLAEQLAQVAVDAAVSP